MKRIELISKLVNIYFKNHNISQSQAWLMANESLDLIERSGMTPPKTTKHKKVRLVDDSGQLFETVQVNEWDHE